MVTIRQVALRAGVSPATVSRVLSGTAPVNEEKRQRVLRAVEELGYRPNQLARSLAHGRLSVIHLIIGDIRNPFYAELARGVEDVGYEHGFTVVVSSTDDNPEREALYLHTTADFRAAGLVLSTALPEQQLLAHLQRIGCPVVLLNRYHPSVDADAVLLDNHMGGYLATRHLLDLGHRKIAHLAGPVNSSASRERLEGFRAAVREFGLDPDQLIIDYGNLRHDSGYRMGQRLVAAGMPVTAVFAGNDLMALGVMEAVTQAGLRVPEDLSVVGFDDTNLSGLWTVLLTTVRQPQYEMGRAAGELLVRRLSDPKGTANRRVVFAPELVVRRSTARPSGSRGDKEELKGVVER